MIMADLLTWTLGVAGMLAVSVSYWLATQGLFPRLVTRTSGHYQKPVRATLVGLAVFVPAGLLGVLAFQAGNPVVKSIGALLIGLSVLIGLVGSCGLCHRIGAGLASELDEKQPWRRVLRGGIVLALTFLLPVVGWFVILPWTLISGLGAALLSLRPERSPEQPRPVVSGQDSPSPSGVTG